MAAQPARKLEESSDEFNNLQLGALEDVWRTKHGGSNEKVLDAAKEIGLITDKTGDLIDDTLKDANGQIIHPDLFGKALDKEQKAAEERERIGGVKIDKAAVFKRAFESVYGRFLLEQGPRMVKNAEGNSVIAEGEMEHQDHPFMIMLDKVLKVKVSPEFGLKGRSELQAVVRRLKEVTAARGVGEKFSRELRELDTKKTTLEAKKADLEPKNAVLRGANGVAAELKADFPLDELAEIGIHTDESHDRLAFLRNDATKLDEELNNPSLVNRLASYIGRINSFQERLSEFRDTIQAYDFDASKVDAITQLLTELEAAKADPNFSDKTWGAFLNDKLKPFLKSIKSGSYIKSEKSYPDSRKVFGNKILDGQIQKLNNAIEWFVKGMPYLSDYYDVQREASDNPAQAAEFDAGIREDEGRAQEVTEDAISRLEEMAAKIEQLKNPALEALVGGISAKCEAYLGKFAMLKGHDKGDRPALIKTFIDTKYKPFVEEISAMIAESLSTNSAELAEATTFLESEYVTETKRLKAYKSPALMLEGILERAFGKQRTPEDMKKLERESHEAGARKTALEETHKYFSGEETKDVQRKYEDLNPSVASAKDIRSKEAESKKTEENKAKLGKLKELFAADKTTTLNDVFQQLEALLPQYAEALKVKDIDKDIATKVTEAGLLEKEIEAYQKSTKIFEKEKIPKKSGQLKRLRAKIAVLERQKAKRDQFKELAKKFRTELQTYCREYLEAFKLGVTASAAVTKDRVEAMMPDLNALNVEKGFDFTKLAGYYHLLEGGFTAVFDQVKAKLDNPELGVQTKQKLDTDKANVEKAKKFHEELKPIVEKILKANKFGVRFVTGKIKNKIGFQIDPLPRETQEQADERANKEFIEGMEEAFKEIKPDHMDFNVGIVTGFYATYLEEFLGSASQRTEFLKRIEAGMVKAEKKAKVANKELTLAKEAAEKCKDLTDPQAALKIVGVLVAEQFPKLSMTEQEKLAKLVLAGDVAKLQTEEDYEELAKRGSAEDLKLDVLENLAIKGKLIGFKYQEGDKEVQPFKGMKPENFKDWASIEKLFNLGQLNHKNGFFLMAALEIFDEQKSHGSEVGVVRSVQSLRVEDKLKFLLAKQLGVHERMHVAGVNKIINDAFKEQMEKVRPLVKAHFDTYDKEWDKDGKGVKSHKIQLLNLKYEELNDKLRKGEIDHAVYEIKLKALVKEATDADVMEEVGFSQNSMLSGFWHSKYSQWIRDRGHDVGKYVGKKALRFGWGSVKGGALGSLNAAGWLGLRGTSLGVGLAKWPTAILTGIGSGIFSIFRRGKWMDNVKKDVGKVMSTAGGWQDSMKGKAKGVKILSPVGKQIAGEWGKSKYGGSKYADRNKKKEDRRAEKLKVLEEKAQLKAVGIASSPFIDLAQYKAKIEELDKILGTTTKFPAEGNVRVGHEEKPAANSDKKNDHGHQPPAAAAHS